MFDQSKVVKLEGEYWKTPFKFKVPLLLTISSISSVVTLILSATKVMVDWSGKMAECNLISILGAWSKFPLKIESYFSSLLF
ncbi:hypothetical protein WICPIJ_004524 [Wickerhamomyces pijperi]|uniref:Uncharacterized protein n=1 Tax=Wickerhamomyces pijperi TaxID=599730 RepID=A0A9P8TMU3_WICPI|nr:hypothetical protein WICPIJ_004524 [Wickerhamomyces pijperi]